MIFYFTGTGNSLYVAEKIQKSEHVKLVDMGRALNENIFNYKVEKGEKIGIIFPVYFYGMPTIVSEFINKLNLETEETPFIYTIITCGSGIGNADKSLAKLLKSKNLELSSSYSIEMPSNYIMIYDPANKEDSKITINAANKSLKKIIDEIKNRKKGYFVKHGISAIVTPIAYRFYGMFRKTKKFRVTEKCTVCGLCETVCPSKAIKMNDERPKWIKQKCSHCNACINRCPSRAIEYGNSTIKRNRYINPYIEF
ncbi:NAD(P)H-quinone oxidoreductase subunit I, chloroplastic [bioreactor metagenome]|uniref:NAD(P)H-quinone oxidoreductase subunit I, chloroplastic n=1 Tax=bioreactor metagenome TaxID=1076179 RepID=A0A644TWI9_9ZZZZ|nr:EFR1 family ferrodoxin [Methanobrevibacter sp.]MEA4956597.1 EFR1 family ferrodoxin [Methanobrevibacter sp.]